jgi:hypothetical protein
LHEHPVRTDPDLDPLLAGLAHRVAVQTEVLAGQGVDVGLGDGLRYAVTDALIDLT